MDAGTLAQAGRRSRRPEPPGSVKVSIAWAVDGEDPSIVHVHWRETGSPKVEPPRRKGFGTSLLNAAFAEVRIDYREKGLSCDFDLRLQHDGAVSPAPA